jgi:hypothetical protein
MHTPVTRRPDSAMAVALILALLAMAGCGGSSSNAAAEPANGEPANISADSTDVVEVTLVDYAFVGLPSSVASGTRLTVVNAADAELHEIVAFHLPDAEQRPVAVLATLAPAELVEVLGEPVTVLLAEPGEPEIPAVGDGTLSEPGRYALMCFIPTGADPQAYLQAAAETEEGPPQVAGGPPHFVQGMHAELTVE